MHCNQEWIYSLFIRIFILSILISLPAYSEDSFTVGPNGEIYTHFDDITVGPNGDAYIHDSDAGMSYGTNGDVYVHDYESGMSYGSNGNNLIHFDEFSVDSNGGVYHNY